jgi:hypothetical protein
MFIAVAAAAGIVAGRLTRNLAAEAKESHEAEASQGPGTGTSGGTAGTGAVGAAAPVGVPPVTEVPGYTAPPVDQSYTATGTIGSTTAPEAGRI